MPIKITGSEAVERRPLLSLKTSGEPSLNPGFIEEQAAKMDLLLGVDSPGQNSLSVALTTGQTEGYKKLLADKDRLEQIESRNSVLQSVMQAEPEAITPEVVDIVRGLSDLEMQSPDLGSIVEEKYARLYTNLATSAIDNGIVEDAMETDPVASLDLLDRTERVVFKKNYVARKAAELSAEIEGMSWGSTVWNFAERMIPFVEWYQKQNAVGAEKGFVSSILPGTNLIEQYSYLWSLDDPRRFREEFDQAYEEMKERNPYTAQSWLEGFFSYGSSDAAIDTLFEVSDIPGLVPVALLGRALKGVAKGAAKSPLKTYQHAADLGKYDLFADGKIVSDLKSGTFFPDNIRNIRALEESVPSIAAPERLMSGADKLPVSAEYRLREALMRDADLARRFLYEPNLVDRAAPEELFQYTDRLREQYVRDNPSVEKNVIDVEVSDTPDVGNVYQARVILGRRDGTLFDSPKEAESYFKRWIKGTDDYQIRQVGQGFQIEILKTVDESQFRGFRLETSQKTPESFANTVLNNLRSPNYTVSRQQELARSTVVTSKERLDEIVVELAKPLRDLPQKEYKELVDLMEWNRNRPRFENYGSFENEFLDKYGKRPTLEQVEGYFAAVRIHDLDLMVRDLDVYKQKVALGLEQIKVKIDGEDFDFEGKVIDELPFGSETPFRFTIVDNGKKRKTQYSQYSSQKDKDEVRRLVEKGYKIIQTSDSLKLGKKDYTEFLVTTGVTRNRVGVKNFERRPELGHKVDTYPGYIKQGKIERGQDASFYRGDTTLFGARTEAEGKEFVSLLEEARQRFLRNDKSALTFVRDTLGIDPKRWTAAVQSGLIDLSIPFAYAKKGSRTIDTGAYSDIKNLRDSANSEHNLRSKITGRYLGERDQSSIDVIQSEADLKFEVQGAEFLNPMDTMRESVQNMVSVRLLNDYTMMTNRNFQREFGDILDGTMEEIQSSGTSFLIEPRFKSGADPIRVQQAKNVSMAYRNLLNYGTDLDRKIDAYKERIVSSVVSKFGPRGVNYVPDRLLHHVKDPGVWLRSAAFNMKLGMFNPIQFFVQMNSLVNVMAVAGANGMKGGLSYPLVRLAALTNDPAKIKRLGKVAENTKLMRAEDFEESMRLYKKSGFHVVGRDTALLDDVTGPELRQRRIGSAVSKTLAWGRTPFQEGERVVRMAAWQAAYLERKADVGVHSLTKRDEAWILQRAKDLVVNMSRESNAPWQKGYAGVFTQFWGYQAKLMEQFIGKKLTSAEKARLFTAYSLIYGLPVAGGAAFGFIPFRDIVLDTALSYGWDVDDTALEPFVDGLASTFYELVIGDELNIADRYGPGGISTFYDILRGDAELSDWLMGASGSIGLETVQDAWKLGTAMWSWYEDGEAGYYNLRPDDFLQPLRNISSVDNATKLYQVWNLGVWASKNGVNLVEMDLPDGIIAALTGLQPAQIEDAFRKQSSTRRHTEWLRSRQTEATKEMRKALQMEPGPEQEKVIRQIKAQMILDGMDSRMRAQVFKNAASNEMLSDKFFENFEKQMRRRERLENRE